MNKAPLFEVSNETRVIKEFLQKQAPDSILDYLSIEQATGIRMDSAGRRRLRSAARSAGLEYDSIPNSGIRLAGPESAIDIAGGKLERIGSAVKRADKSTKRMSGQFLMDMNDENKSRMLQVTGMLGAICAAAEVYREQKRKTTPRIVNSAVIGGD